MKAGFRFLIVGALVGALLAAPLVAIAAADEAGSGGAVATTQAAPGDEKENKGKSGNEDKGNQSDPQNNGNSGSIKTTRDDGQGGEPGNGQGSNANHYTAGNDVVLSGGNLRPATYRWTVSRLSPNPVSPYREGSYTVKSATGGGANFNIPTSGFEPGVYKVEIFLDGKKVKSDNFKIEGGQSTPQDPGDDPQDPGDDADDPGDDQDDPGNSPSGGTPESSTTVVAQAPAPVVAAQAAAAPTAPAPVVIASNLPKAGGPLLAPVALLAGSLLAAVGFGLRRLS